MSVFDLFNDMVDGKVDEFAVYRSVAKAEIVAKREVLDEVLDMLLYARDNNIGLEVVIDAIQTYAFHLQVEFEHFMRHHNPLTLESWRRLENEVKKKKREVKVVER